MYLKKLPSTGDRKEFILRRYAKGKILNVGSGGCYIPGAVNLDYDEGSDPDVLADFHEMPLPDNEFDTVIAIDVIEHTETPEVLVEEIERVVKPEGRIVVACNDFDIQHQNWDANPEHVTYFNEEIFRNLFEPKGYTAFSLYRGFLVATNKPKPFNKILSIIFALYKRPVNVVKKFFKKNKS